MIYILSLIVCLIGGAYALNDWTTPCLSGVCSYGACQQELPLIISQYEATSRSSRIIWFSIGLPESCMSTLDPFLRPPVLIIIVC